MKHSLYHLIRHSGFQGARSFVPILLAQSLLWLAGSEAFGQTGAGYGIAAAEPIGAYLNGVFPASTPGVSGTPQPPATLSATGTFANLSTLTPITGLIPYDVNSPLWTDGALKRRWIAVPNDGSHNSAGERIGFSATEPWDYPVGTVLVKHFELRTNVNNPNIIRRVETRFIVHATDGYYGVTYRWRSNNLDADLLISGEAEDIPMTQSNGSVVMQTWSYPSRVNCMGCHNAEAGYMLGPRTWQLNGDLTYPKTGVTDNQLRALNHIGLFSPALDESQISGYLRSVSLDDTSAPVEDRVRSYLASNCSHCHRPGVTNAFFDARFTVPLSQQGIVNGAVLYSQGIDGAQVIRPQSIGQSIMHLRTSVLGPELMPPIGKNVIHTEAVALLEQWIDSLPADSGTGNHAPVALDDSALTAFQAEVDIDLLANDSDPDGDPLTIVNLTQPSSGLVNQSGGIVTYTPASGFSGDTTFTYQLDDSAGGISQVATVTVTVAAQPTATGLQFTDATSILPNTNVHSGVAMGIADMNGDGMDDLVRLSGAQETLIEFQHSDGTFGHYTMGFAFGAKQWGLALADADGDGMSDFVVGGYYDGLKFFRANSTGTAWTPTNLPGPGIFLQAVNFADIDNDGWLDIFACHDDAESHKYRGDGAGWFTFDPSMLDTSAPPSDSSGNYGTTWSDYDGDGDVDLYISKCRGGVADPADKRRINKLMRNNGDGTFTDVAAAAGMAFGEQSWTADFADIDNDGDLDCFVGNHGAASYMMRNNGNGTFTNVTGASGINENFSVIQVAFRDFDNDGWIDLLMVGSEHRLYLNDGDGTFTLSANLFTADKIESCAVGDLNHDGFVDVYAGYARIYNTPTAIADRLFLNAGNDNHYLAVQLQGTSSNRQGIGARVELTGAWGTQVREVRAGESYGVTYSRTAHFGLGAQPGASSLTVVWPSGTVDTLNNVSGDRYLAIIEGSTAVPAIQAPGAQFGVAGNAVSLQIAATDPTGDTLTYSASGLPGGLAINPSTGRITGTLSVSSIGAHSCSVSASDAFTTVTASFSWSVSPDATQWAQWQQYTPGAGAAPSANGDGDIFDDLMEFAMGSDPNRGASADEGLQLNVSDNAVAATFTRPANLNGVSWILQRSPDLSQWSNVSVSPSITSVGAGVENVAYSGLQNESGLSANEGYLRLKVVLANPVAASYSLPVGWKSTAIQPGYRTHGNGFNRKAVYSGKVASQAAQSLTTEAGSISGLLDSNARYYIEFTSGLAEGHRFDLAATGSAGRSLVLDFAPEAHNTRPTLPAGLAGLQFVVRRHLTVADVYPPSLFKGGRDPALVDQLQFFVGNGYDTVFLLDLGNGSPAFWTSSGNALLEDAGQRILPPGVGCFIRKTSSSNKVTVSGQIRVNQFVQPLRKGLNMFGAPYPKDHSPATRHMLLADGFYGNANPASADQIQVWSGDSSAAESGFKSYFLLDAGAGSAYRFWSVMESAALSNEDNAVLFRKDRAAFLKCAGNRADYVVPGLSYP
ncbi:MAG: FG-GAP-like repeat-containing protein [Verrucomicrobiales bacterium]